MRVVIQSIYNGDYAVISGNYSTDDAECYDEEVFDNDQPTRVLPEEHQMDGGWNDDCQSCASHSTHQIDE